MRDGGTPLPHPYPLMVVTMPLSRPLRGAAAATVILAVGVSPALAAPVPDAPDRHYALHPLTGDVYLLRDLSVPEQPAPERTAAGDDAPDRDGTPAQELLRVLDPDPAALSGADAHLPEEALVPLAHTPVADPADFFVVALDGTLHTVHADEEETLLVSYRAPDGRGGARHPEAEEPPRGADGEEPGAYTVDIHPLPDTPDLAAVRSDERGVFLIAEDGSVLLLEHTEDADGALEVTLTPYAGPAPDREPWQPPEEAVEPPAEAAEPPNHPAEAGPHTGGAAPADAEPDGTDRARPPQPEAATDPVRSETAADPAAEPGALVMTLPEGPVLLSGPQLSGDGSHQRVTGDLAPATVSDLRGTGAGWSLVGQVSDLRGTTGASIGAHLLGWEPAAEVLDGPAGSGVRPGAAVRPGDGLAVPRTLCATEAGSGPGVFTCRAGLELGIPADTPSGEYVGVLTLTLS